jgi:hypothetical protein
MDRVPDNHVTLVYETTEYKCFRVKKAMPASVSENRLDRPNRQLRSERPGEPGHRAPGRRPDGLRRQATDLAPEFEQDAQVRERI